MHDDVPSANPPASSSKEDELERLWREREEVRKRERALEGERDLLRRETRRPIRTLVVRLHRGIQLAPPSVVHRIVPPSPTAVPVLASTKDTPRRRAARKPAVTGRLAGDPLRKICAGASGRRTRFVHLGKNCLCFTARAVQPRNLMTLIDDLMPEYSFREVDHVAVTADAVATWTAARAIDLYQIRWVRNLFRLRTLPNRIASLMRDSLPASEATARIEDITNETGFLIVGEEPGREVVVGSVGKFWQAKIEFARVAPANFTSFSEADFGKLAWSLRVDPRDDGGAWITIDLRVAATDGASLARFRRYWTIIGRFSRAIRRAVLSECAEKLGALVLDRTRRLPGDEILAVADAQQTHAITIEAPPASVWPWLVQMGCQRAGFYSIDRLDNAGIESADHIIPELEHIAVGNIIPARPTGEEGFAVLRVEPDRLLVLGSPQLLPNSGKAWSLPYLMTWAFVLEPIGSSATQLIVRVRGAARPGRRLRARVTAAAVLAAHEIMERAQLSGLKRRVERLNAAAHLLRG